MNQIYERAKKLIDNSTNTNWGNNNKCIIYSLFSVFVELIIVKLYWGGFSFLTNDDAMVQAALNGTLIGEMYPYHQFINCILGVILCFINRYIMTNRIWFFFLLLCSIVGLILLHYTVFRVAGNMALSMVTIFAFACLFEMYNLSNVSFTITPILLCIGAISILFIEENLHIISPKKIVLISFIIVFSSLIRYESAIAILPIYFIVLYYYSKNSAGRHNFLINFLIVMGVFLLIFSANYFSNYVQNELVDGTFHEFNTYRAVFMDYPHPNYNEATEVYSKYGWDEETFELIDSMCYLPKEFSLEALKGICTELELSRFGFYLTEGTLYKIKKFFCLDINIKTYYGNLKVIVILSLILCMVIYIFMNKMKKKKNLLINTASVSCVCSILLLCYLIICNRVELRAALCTFIPMICIMAISFVKLYEKVASDLRDLLGGKKFELCSRIFYVMIMLVSVIVIHSYLLSHMETLQFRNISIRGKKYYDYIEKNPDMFFIYGDALAIPIEDDYYLPSNSIFWGGACVGSDLNKKMSEINGFDTITMETLNEENVYFIGKTSLDYDVIKINNYLSKKGIMARYKVIDRIEDVGIVYKFYW